LFLIAEALSKKEISLEMYWKYLWKCIGKLLESLFFMPPP